MSADAEAHVAAGLQRLAPMIVPGARSVDGVHRLSGGASQQTWRFDVQAAAGAVPLILRRAPDGAAERTQATAGLASEARLIAAAKAAGVPVPAIRHVLRPEDGLGTGLRDGAPVGRNAGSAHRARCALGRSAAVLARQCGEALARIHAMPIADLPPLRRGGPQAELQFQMDQHRHHATVRPVFELGVPMAAPALPERCGATGARARRLPQRQPDGRRGGLRAVLDWELAHLGDPMEDLGWICVNSWRFGAAICRWAASARARNCSPVTPPPAAWWTRSACTTGKCWAP